ncbi:MAG: S-layer homology domain-containing protein [Thermoleophilia bacterium]
MSSRSDERVGIDVAIEEVTVGRRRRRWSIGRVVLNVLVVVAFAGAVFALYSLIQGSGVLGDVEEVVPLSFEDVPAEYVHTGIILESVEKGLVVPASPTRFGPGDRVTRGEFAGVVVRTLEWPVEADETHSFIDVTGDPEVVDESDYIAVVATKGVMGGAGDSPPTFAPTVPIPMRHLIVVFARAAGDALPEPPATQDPDVQALSVNEETRAAYQRLAAAGILDGVDLDADDAALEAEVDREQVAIVAVNLRRFLTDGP